MEFEESKESFAEYEAEAKKKLKFFQENTQEIDVENCGFGKETLENEMSNLRINPKKRRLEGVAANLQLKKKH